MIHLLLKRSGKMIPNDISNQKKLLMFDLLDALRQSGEINMFGSGIYLEQAYGLNKRESKEVVLEWMRTFGERNQND
jgi:hypothetical protein